MSHKIIINKMCLSIEVLTQNDIYTLLQGKKCPRLFYLFTVFCIEERVGRLAISLHFSQLATLTIGLPHNRMATLSVSLVFGRLATLS